jgi:ABC-type multidrug transport system fused ATPase/permease subunit
VTSFIRLLRYARPYRGRLILALVATVVYGAASYGLARMVAPILDAALPRQERLAQTIGLILALYLTKGLAPIAGIAEMQRAAEAHGQDRQTAVA